MCLGVLFQAPIMDPNVDESLETDSMEGGQLSCG